MKNKFKLYDRIRVKATGDIGYIVDIRPSYLTVEKEGDSDDKMLYGILPEEIEKAE